MAQVNIPLFIDLETLRFVRSNDPRIGLREESLTEGGDYTGNITVYSGVSCEGGEVVNPTSVILHVADKSNSYIYQSATVAEDAGSYTLKLIGQSLRNDIAGKLSIKGVLFAIVEIDGQEHLITPLPLEIIGSPADNTAESILDALNEHVADKENPHEVTKAQVGLGNVENTADLAKPVSTATQTALNDLAADLSTQIPTSLPWSAITGKPTTFPPATHTHPWSEVTDKPTTFPPSVHSHVWADITDRPNTGEFATQAQLTATGENLTTQLAATVKTSGDQSILGNKTFLGTLGIGSNPTTAYGITIDPSNARIITRDATTSIWGIDLANQRLVSKGFTFSNYTLDWGTLELGGRWSMALLPTQPNHLANKTYVDSAITTFGGNVVYTTGNQVINGDKSFNNNIIFNSGVNLETLGPRRFIGTAPNFVPSLLLFGGGNASQAIGRLNINNTVALDWTKYTLSGEVWSMNYPATLPQHIINLGFLQTGNFSLANVVRTTGNQAIGGSKNFTSYTLFNQGAGFGFIPSTTYEMAINPNAGSFTISDMGGDTWGIDFANKQLKGPSSNFSTAAARIDWNDNILSGFVWTMNYSPTQSGHLTNKGYVDRLVTGGNIPNVVYTTGNQGIGGTKTFSNYINVPGIGPATSNGSPSFVPTIIINGGVNSAAATGALAVNGAVGLDWVNRRLSGTWTSQAHNVLGTLGIGNGGATIVGDAFAATFNKDIKTPFGVEAQLLITRSNFGGEVRFIDEDATNLNKNISIFANDQKLGIAWQAGDYSASREWFNATRDGLNDPHIGITARSFFIENTGGAVAQSWFSNTVTNSTAITEHYGRTGTYGVGSYARMGGTYGVAGSSYGVFSDTALNLLANNGDINLTPNGIGNVWVRGGSRQLKFENNVADKITFYSNTYGIGIRNSEVTSYVGGSSDRFTFGVGPYSSFVEGARIYGSGSAEFKKVTTTSGFLVNVNTSGLLPDPVFGSKNVSGLYYDFQVDSAGNVIAASYATSQASIQSFDESYRQYAGAVLQLPDDANVIRYSNAGNAAVSFTGVSGAANGSHFIFTNSNPTGTVTFTHNGAIRVRGGSNLTLAPLESCYIASLNSTGVSVF